MTRFAQALRAEWLKIFTTKTWWILTLIMVVYLGFTALLLGATLSTVEADPIMVYTTASTIGFIFPLLLGTLAVTGEFRHHTIIPTFLTVPKRGLVLAAKLLVHFVLGAAMGVIAFATTIGAGAFFFSGQTGLDQAETWQIIGRCLLVMALWAAVGVGVGSLVPNQAAALVVVIGFTQFLEPTLRLVAAVQENLAPIGKFLPGAASDALGGASFYSSFSSMTGSGAATGLLWWQAGLVFLGYGALAVGLGYWLRWRRGV
ncbi:ABC transporter permease [Scrofimicrobium sp. R131]|uniref:ABC transporter permease n=1 Tax=Scrofimicrobium appendicitidis TaxID=3079930 RepID=A0AAU7V745_9ACTO